METTSLSHVSPGRTAATAVDWAAAEGWNPGLDDAARFLEHDPGAFIGVARDGEMAGTVSCALYGDHYAFIGFYIVRPDLRGRGIGLRLFEEALHRAGERSVGLDGVLAQQNTYALSGFVPAHRSRRWAGKGGGSRPAGLIDLDAVAFEALAAYDRAIFGAPRDAFLRAWIRRPPGHALAAVRDGRLAGYGVLRPCRTGAKIGPLFADDTATALRILAGLRATAGPQTDVFLDVPGANAQAVALAAATLAAPVFETVRMYRGTPPPEDVERIFGVTTFELG